MQIFSADGRTDGRTDGGSTRGPRGPKNCAYLVKGFGHQMAILNFFFKTVAKDANFQQEWEQYDLCSTAGSLLLQGFQ